MNAPAANLEALSRLQPLGSLCEKNLQELLPLCRRDSFERNVDPLREHDWTGRVMYLMKGQLKVDADNGAMDILVGGHDRALFPVCWDGHRPTGSKAITNIEVLSLEEEPLDIVVTWDQVAQASGTDDSGDQTTPEGRRMSGMFSIENLTSGALSALPAANIDALLKQFEPIAVHRGDIIIQQGDPGDYYFMIERGRCKVTRLVAGAPVELAELREGDVFGEEALLADSLRNATVTMNTDGTLLRLAKEVFVKMLREPLMKRLDAVEARQKITEGATLIDVRFPAEFQANGLPNAVNIPLNDIRQASSLLDRNRQYIVYCQTGRRSAAAAFLLSQRGIHASLLEGGLKAMPEIRESVT